MNETNAWYLAEDGATVGMTGPEGGEIWKDEEHPDGARVTLERDTLLGAPFALTATVYGWLVQTLFYADQPTALQQFDAVKPQLADIAALAVAERSAEAADAVDRFAAQYS